MFASDEKATSIKSSGDFLGFDKTLIFLTRPNKLVAVSSLGGKTLWSRLIREPVRRMILDVNDGSAVIDIVTSKGNLIKVDPTTGAINSISALPELAQSVDDSEFIVAQGYTTGKPDQHRTALIAVPKSGEGSIVNLKPEIELVREACGPSYYTQVRKADGKIYGYRLNSVTMKSENTWRMILDAD